MVCHFQLRRWGGGNGMPLSAEGVGGQWYATFSGGGWWGGEGLVGGGGGRLYATFNEGVGGRLG